MACSQASVCLSMAAMAMSALEMLEAAVQQHAVRMDGLYHRDDGSDTGWSEVSCMRALLLAVPALELVL